jgi:hypothetical protein
MPDYKEFLNVYTSSIEQFYIEEGLEQETATVTGNK